MAAAFMGRGHPPLAWKQTAFHRITKGQHQKIPKGRHQGGFPGVLYPSGGLTRVGFQEGAIQGDPPRVAHCSAGDGQHLCGNCGVHSKPGRQTHQEGV